MARRKKRPLIAILTRNDPVKSPQAKAVDQALGRAIGAVGILAVSTVVFPPLQWLALPLYFQNMGDVFKRAYQDLFVERRLTQTLPVSLMLGGLVFAGYFPVGILLLFLTNLSDKLYLMTRSRSESKIISLLGQQPKELAVLIDGQEVMIPFEQVKAGAHIVVYAGEMMPVDGTVVQGEATVDQQALTGEAQPVEVMVGSAVLAATTVVTGKLIVNVVRSGNESVAGQITDVLNQTASYQTTIESWSEEIVNKAVPYRLALSALALPVAGTSGALACLMASWGNGMRSMGPLTILSFLNIASSRQILIKDGRSLELLPKITAVVFDKTGTLTMEQPHVTAVHTANGFGANEVLAYAASSEYKQSHPIARAIIEHAEAQAVALTLPDETAAAVGFGIKTWINGLYVLVGSERYMDKEGVLFPAALAPIQKGTAERGDALVYVAVNGDLAGAIELRSTLRDEIPALVADLHRRGITTYIISGDHEAPTRTLAQTIGVDHYYAETLPADKARIVDELQAQGQSVCFVGDGINDSIALRKAHVSISLRGATTIATDAAQIVMMDESLAKLPLLFDLSKEFETLMKVNYGIALFPSIVMVSGVFLHFISITGAILFGMSWFYLGLLVPFVPQLQYRVRPRLSLHNPSSDPHTITTETRIETRIETRGDPTNVPDPQTR